MDIFFVNDRPQSGINTITLQFSHEIFWGYSIVLEHSRFEMLLKSYFISNIQDLTSFCVQHLKHFLREHNLLSLYDRLCIEEQNTNFHIHHKIDTLEKVFELVKNNNVSIFRNDVHLLLADMGNITYICNNCSDYVN